MKKNSTIREDRIWTARLKLVNYILEDNDIKEEAENIYFEDYGNLVDWQKATGRRVDELYERQQLLKKLIEWLKNELEEYIRVSYDSIYYLKEKVMIVITNEEAKSITLSLDQLKENSRKERGI